MTTVLTHPSDLRPSRGRRVARRIGVLLLFLLVVLLLSAAAVGVGRTRERALPTPAGPYPVGRSVADLGPDHVATWLWYPAAPVVGDAPGVYVPDGWYGGILPLAQGGYLLQDLDTMRTHAHDDAPPARLASPAPVVVFGPGLGIEPWVYSTIAEDLASRGVVVAVSVPATTPAAVHRGTPVGGEPPSVDDDAAVAELVATQAADLRAVTDALAIRVPVDRVVFAGHSLGGAAALEACRTDGRCAGAVDIDGAVTGPVVRAGLNVPVMLLGGAGSCAVGPPCDAGEGSEGLLDATRTLLEQLRGPVTTVRVDGASHLDFTDLPQMWLAPGFATIAGRGSVDPGAAALATTVPLAGFVDRVLRGRADELPVPAGAHVSERPAR